MRKVLKLALLLLLGVFNFFHFSSYFVIILNLHFRNGIYISKIVTGPNLFHFLAAFVCTCPYLSVTVRTCLCLFVLVRTGPYRTHRTVLERTGPHLTALPCWNVLDCTGPIGPYWTVLDCTGPYRTVLDRTRPYWTVLDRTGPNYT